ncbi:MAG: hypothetical protein M0Z62_14365, partial [Actinomycetota bacterium]|nr:hypothetical protein [Actinomycetota bacterium]
AKAQGIEATNRSLLALIGRFRAQRRLRRLADESGGTASEFDRATFLLGKQLMYFERYGKMFLADVPLLHDREFFESLVASAPDVAAGSPFVEGGGADRPAVVRGTESAPTTERQGKRPPQGRSRGRSAS